MFILKFHIVVQQLIQPSDVAIKYHETTKNTFCSTAYDAKLKSLYAKLSQVNWQGGLQCHAHPKDWWDRLQCHAHAKGRRDSSWCHAHATDVWARDLTPNSKWGHQLLPTLHFYFHCVWHADQKSMTPLWPRCTCQRPCFRLLGSIMSAFTWCFQTPVPTVHHVPPQSLHVITFLIMCTFTLFSTASYTLYIPDFVRILVKPLCIAPCFEFSHSRTSCFLSTYLFNKISSVFASVETS